MSNDPTLGALFDTSYLQALTNCEPATEDHLVAYFSRSVRLNLKTWLRSPELAQDAQQETFLRVLTFFRSGKTLNNPASLPSFVRGVCHNVALELLRAYTRDKSLPEDAPEPADRSPDPERQMLARERREMVHRMLSGLKEKDRRLLFRVSLNEESREEVCRECQVDRDYLRVLLYRAKQRLKSGFVGSRWCPQ
jgi:RNA polymerase sigma-70 factor, ECF subfamily